jgi:hypothetical protein
VRGGAPAILVRLALIGEGGLPDAVGIVGAFLGPGREGRPEAVYGDMSITEASEHREHGAFGELVALGIWEDQFALAAHRASGRGSPRGDLKTALGGPDPFSCAFPSRRWLTDFEPRRFHNFVGAIT